MKFFLLSFSLILCLVRQESNAQTTENVIGWNSWVNFTNWNADQGLTANLNMPLTAVGADAVVFSDAGDGYGQRAFTTGWASGANSKAWKFQLTTTKYATLKFSCKMMGTNNFTSFLGPRDFKLQYSLDGSSWVDVTSGGLTAGNGNGNFNSLTNIALPAACENKATIYLRMLMTSNTAVTGGTVSGGQSHIDDILLTGISVPEAPTDIILSNNFLLAPSGGSVAGSTTVGTMTSTDFNLGNTFTYSLVSGTGSTDNASFSIMGNTLSTGASLSAGTYSIRVRTTDNSSLWFEKQITIIVSEPDPVTHGTRIRMSAMGPDGNTSFNASAGTAVAYNSVNNEYLTVWQGDDNTSPLVDNEFEIFGQRSSAANGTSLGSRIRISFMGPDGNTSYRGATPSVAYNSTNNEYLVVWSGDHNSGSLVATEFEIWGQRINAATGALSGSMFRISTMGPDGNASYDATVPDIAWNATGNEYMVTWQADDNTSPLVDNENEIYAQRVSNTGSLTGSRIKVSTMGPNGNTSYTGSMPAITWNSTSNEYMIVWSGDDNTSPLVDNENEIFGQIITNAGVLSVSRIRISFMGPNGNTSFNASNPDVAYNNFANEYFVVWQGDDNTAPLVDNENEIFGQRLASGAITGSRIRISDMGPDGSTSYAATIPKLIYQAAAKEYWVVWQGDDNYTSVDGENEIFMQRLDGSSAAATGNNDIRLSYMGTSSSIAYAGLQPAIASNSSDSKAFAAWRGDDNTSPLVDNEFEMFGQPLSVTLSILPVNWLSFTATPSGKNVLLDWKTSNELMTRDFTIQHSTDGGDWKNVGIVASAGNSSSTLSYSFTHRDPKIGKNYYRLLQTDIDGHKSYSKIAVADFGEKTGVILYPNPVADQLTLQLPNNSDAVIKVYDNAGQLIRQQKYNSSRVSINIHSLSTGIYYLKVYQQNNTFIRSFLKK